MINEGQIARQPGAGLNYPWNCCGMQHDTDFHALSEVLEFQNTENRLIKSAQSLDDIIVDVIDRSVDRYSHG